MNIYPVSDGRGKAAKQYDWRKLVAGAAQPVALANPVSYLCWSRVLQPAQSEHTTAADGPAQQTTANLMPIFAFFSWPLPTQAVAVCKTGKRHASHF
jgi:hypothetical protein